LTDGEFDRINELLGRVPNDFELAVFSLLWSEHCGYKHSARLLARFPSEGEHVLQGPGENAGVVDVGDGLAVAFKVESHNHPSAVEPFQGAATGVGGILRDIIAMGARPIALLDSIRFGDLEQPHQRWLFSNAVAGIGHYGNCVGVPNVGGECVFDPAYKDNCLVNAMCVGLLPADRVTRATASGPGNLIVLYGATTGRDGIGGASVLASQELSDEDADKRPTVQIGDPFMGKKLIEVSLELVEQGHVVSLQDLGAAGLASSLSEMAARGGAGVDVHLDRVPQREDDMVPAELIISESQERMVAVVAPEQLEAVQAVCEKWELASAVLGEVTDSGLLRCFFNDTEVGSIPATLLTDAPRYDVARTPRARVERVGEKAPTKASPSDLLQLMGSQNIASRAWVYEQYDQLVQSRTVRRPGLDAAVLLLTGKRGLAVSLDGSGRMARLDPRIGGSLAALEAARNVACAGGRPIAMTNCLNFGNPEKGDVGWELAEAIEGIALACEAVDVPIVSGNVSLYNETDGEAIYPTPAVGCVGLLDDVHHVPGRWNEGDTVMLLGSGATRLDGSEYESVCAGMSGGELAPLDLAGEAALIEALWRVAPDVSLLHDVSLGGLGVALAESAIFSGIGAELDLRWDAVTLFGEGIGQAVVACRPGQVAQVHALGVPSIEIGQVGGGSILDVEVKELASVYAGGLPKVMAN
jgi:phosphoribosylformylglycinamidine synthase II